MNNYYIKVFSISLFLAISLGLFAQPQLSNTSLEDEPADATMPSGWFAASSMTTPDILPGYWGVYMDAEDGETYVGLITRADGSFESIGQRFSEPLEKGHCYNLGLSLSHSDNYTGYNKPLKLRVWIADKKNKRQQMIYESPLIDTEDWEFFEFDFSPESSAKYIILEAHNASGKRRWKGNILLDGISQLRNCNRV